MEILKTLILGWSLVISSTLFFKGANGASVFAAVLYRSTKPPSYGLPPFMFSVSG
jgi:hypothetical protein